MSVKELQATPPELREIMAAAGAVSNFLQINQSQKMSQKSVL